MFKAKTVLKVILRLEIENDVKGSPLQEYIFCDLRSDKIKVTLQCAVHLPGKVDVMDWGS